MCVALEPFKTGDILVVGTWPIPIFDHYAIVFYKDVKPFVAHNSFKSSKIIITPLDEFLERKIRRVIKSDGSLTDEYIYNKTIELNESGKSYNFFGYNCESYVREICGCNWGTDQRKEFILVVIFVVILGIILYKILK